MNAPALLESLKCSLQFVPIVSTGIRPGNLSIGRGAIAGEPAHVALVESRIASGSLGADECDRLAALCRLVAMERGQLVLFLDSAGARVSEGLVALGAFRRLMRDALAMSASGAGFQVVLGNHCFGGASMLAALANARGFTQSTRLAMSGPSILAQAAGGSALDETFLAISQAAIGSSARVALGEGSYLFDPGLALSSQAPTDARARHASLGARLQPHGARAQGVETITRKDLAKMYPHGYEAQANDGVLAGVAREPAGDLALLGLIGNQALTARRAWHLADAIWSMLAACPAELQVLVDCESHSTSLEDERLMLSSYVIDLASALHALGATGCTIRTRVLTKLGGGVYVALAAPSSELAMLYGAQIHVLPGKAIASILGANAPTNHSFADYQAAGVAEQEIKLGIL